MNFSFARERRAGAACLESLGSPRGVRDRSSDFPGAYRVQLKQRSTNFAATWILNADRRYLADVLPRRLKSTPDRSRIRRAARRTGSLCCLYELLAFLVVVTCNNNDNDFWPFRPDATNSGVCSVDIRRSYENPLRESCFAMTSYFGSAIIRGQ